MRLLPEWMLRLRDTLLPHRSDDDLQEELRLHLEMAAAEARRRGHEPERNRHVAAAMSTS